MWRVSRVSVASSARMRDGRIIPTAFYPLVVEGINELANGEPFFWNVPSVSNPAYDLSGAEIEPDAMQFIRAGEVRS